MIDKIKEKALALAPVMEELFQLLHRCPELGREEHRTANLIRRRLEELGIPYTQDRKSTRLNSSH